ncbi:MAG TPA: hypothetical protein VGU23_01555 [Acidobacteriaceae bacterium]|nr:hypothetical protein [Acidobacteriaceae bacterium]
MTTVQKIAAAVVAVGLIAIAGEVLYIHHERTAAWAPATSEGDSAAQSSATDPDDLVFLKKKRPSSLADAKQLVGATLWVSAGGQMEYYPYAAHHADFSKSAGTLLGAEPLIIIDAFEQVAPKQAQTRIPGGDRQVLLAFTLPKSSDSTRQYAVPVGYKQGGDYTFSTDEIFFYDDPHQLYSHWSPQIWQAVDSHQVILGMNERQVQLSLGQVSRSDSTSYGDRIVTYANLGKPIAVTFVKNRVTAFTPQQSF